ncbi:hypothetical protein D9757_005743 [Collybiopsis confluens]|uniref:Uncharacterized protein n=1 Tax=Collybiopsis confluens TaxID=2823264 RepID=A0A8H5HQ16_9AGAR|nr:hypothetical protein D9757_005743 [Collybiopsis confluens]
MFAVIPDDIKEKIANSGCGMEMSWEAFIYRVPLIIWPYQADQPYNATLMSRNHEVAFELFAVRTGNTGERVPYVFKDAPSDAPSFTPDGVKFARIQPSKIDSD